MSHLRSPIQFSLRTALLAMIVVGIIAANWAAVAQLPLHFYWPGLIGVVVVSFMFGMRLRPNVFYYSYFALLAWLTVTLLVFWTRSRWHASRWEAAWPKPFPYPDALLLRCHDWLDAQFPPPEGALKLHGEFYLVLLALNAASWVACGGLAFQIGRIGQIGYYLTSPNR